MRPDTPPARPDHLPRTNAITTPSRPQDESGFTLVEILVVVLIVAVLVAIALSSFLSQRRTAEDADAKLVVRTAQTAFETARTESDSYVADVTRLRSIEPALRGGLAATALTVSATSDSYEITVTSATGNVFTLEKASSGATTRVCTTDGEAGCPSGGRW